MLPIGLGQEVAANLQAVGYGVDPDAELRRVGGSRPDVAGNPFYGVDYSFGLGIIP